ncbi:GMC family oxidoreductase [Kangiella koreensis]|uniref:Glucose-methanol-choline oxidoreductase n=1 Tax=Kangiella koreensis (strain DSM 16069 / JCM 12317 / KCTC 12182 / SW-125) TaxID=523791 RepID=C7R7V9_KANKD|nr:GMC family oxidoreductase [Kangiella koreensis]ACV27642.1 glucose-methanol-choline oxidoreductase [Kangiella koreensis DSM 16069]
MKTSSAIDAAYLQQKKLSADVVIIGSGAGGGVSAEIFAQAGYRVLLIEEGPLKTARDFKMREKDAYPQLYQESAGRKTLDKAINILQGRSVGGSTTINWTTSFRTPEQTLLHWKSNFGIEAHNQKTLAPWFDTMEQRLNIEPWQVPANENNQTIANGAEKLGWSHSGIARNVKGCANLGYCGLGCPINAKQSMLTTTIPAALKAGAQLIYKARVERINYQKDKVTGCELVAMDDFGQPIANRKVSVTAPLVILSAGAIGSPAVLLRSQVPDPNKVIGKRTFLHPTVISAAIMPEAVNGYAGAPQSIYSDHFLWPDSEDMGFKIEAAPLHPLLTSTVLTSFGQQHFDLMQQFPNIQGSIALLRDGFDERSVGGEVILDDYGFPKLKYELNDYFWRSARQALLAMAEMQFAAGAEKVLPLHLYSQPYTDWQQAKSAIEELPMESLKALVFSAHVMGGCAMGSDKARSVVDETGRFHHLKGLYIFDGSIFPTSIGANPQLSIYALVAKLASQLAATSRIS